MVKLADALVTAATPGFHQSRFRTKGLDLPKNPLFSSLSRQQLQLVLPFVKRRKFRRGKMLLEEGLKNKGQIFIVLDGQVAIMKEGISPLDKRRKAYEIGVLKRGDIAGEASFLDGRRCAASFVAKTNLTVAVLDLSGSLRNPHTRRIKAVISTKLRKHLASFADEAIALRLNSMRVENEFAAYRSGVGHIIVTTLCLLSFYTLMLSFLPSFKNFPMAGIALSPLIILMFSLSFIPVVARSGFPLEFFGLRFSNWKRSLCYSAKASGLFLVAFLVLKQLLILSFSAFANIPLIGIGTPDSNGGLIIWSNWYWLALSIYLLLTPMQEFVARSAIQAPLYAFLHGSEAKRRWLSILVSNMVFTAAHAHISIAFALAAFLPGMLWGWIFARTHSWVAATASHLLVGGTTIFFFGVEQLVSKMAHMAM